MAEARDLNVTFKQRWSALGLAETAPALPIDVTVRPAESNGAKDENETPTPARGPSYTRPDPSALPRISLAFADTPTPEGSPDARTRADLEVLAVIGEGGMGRVHAARQRSLDREVAVKTLRRGRVSPATASALLREAVITGRLEHPAIVPVHALGIDDHGAPVLVMKRVEGVEWRALMLDAMHPAWASRPGDRLSAHLEILMQVCQAVHFANTRGVIHCDIKPENVMLGEFGEVYLVDWGIAMRADEPQTLIERDGLVGTPAYMAPELVSGSAVGATTDVYLLGATLHQILTGQFRHEGSTLQEALLSAFCSEPFSYAPNVPAELAELANRATHRKPEHRPKSALEFRQAIADFLEHKSSVALADEAAERLQSLARLLASANLHEATDDLRRAYQLVTESRFGFTQALKEWPKNPAAERGLSMTLGLAVELELAQGHVESAQALLAEIQDAPPALAGKVRDARHQAARERAENERLQAMAEDLDTRVAGRERARGLAAISGAALAISCFALSQPNPARIKASGLLAFACVIFVVMLGATLAFRRSLFKNAINRRLVGMVLIIGLALVVSRAFGVYLGMPAPLIFLQDLLLCTFVTAAAAATLLRWLWLLAAVCSLAAVGCAVWPESSPFIFAIAGVFMPPLGALAMWRHRIEAEVERELAIPESARLE